MIGPMSRNQAVKLMLMRYASEQMGQTRWQRFMQRVSPAATARSGDSSQGKEGREHPAGARIASLSLNQVTK
jgi:hypothetical protein